MKESIKILTVDDEHDLTGRIEKYFKTRGFIIDTANSGIEALHLLNKKKFNVVILDLLMPDMTGIEVLEVIKSKYPNICVIILSVLGQEENLKTSIKLGAYAHITKPFDFCDLEKAVRDGTKIQ